MALNEAVPRRDVWWDRNRYLAGLAVFAVVLVGYVWTLAPTVTFWDAGEFIATAAILGIPHPPGTPLFVVLANVWAALTPVGEFAFRTNLMTATFSAGAAALFFLVVLHGLKGWLPAARSEEGWNRGAEVRWTEESRDSLFTVGGAVAAALVSAYAFTVWQNSNETEVYMVAAFSIAAICWLAWLWRKNRGRERAPHLLLLIVYLGAVSIGNHLMTLLVGPALIGFMWHVLRNEPLANEQDRQIEWAQWWVIVGVWALLIGTGLGSVGLLVLGGLVFFAAAVYAASTGGLKFAVTVLGIAAVGVSTYLFLFLRAKVGPFINEADPSTWENLLAVIRREQYPPRLPTDNPIYPSGAGNPGRSLSLIGLQILNYLQYFDWQWSNGLAATEPVFAKVRLPFTMAFSSLGIYGASVLYRRDRSIFWLLVLLFVTTGPGLVGYMNFKPGFSLAWDQYPVIEMHEVRERDYFFTVSFQVWGLLAGIGIAGLYRVLREWLAQRSAMPEGVLLLPAGVLAIAILPFVLNFTAASRRHGPEARLAQDFSYDVLQSAEPYGIVFTNGDNDTFPLWYAQEVAGVRRDVTIVNLSLGNTDWYIRQLRDNPVRPFEPEQAPWYAHLAPDTPPGPLHSWSDAQIDRLRSQVLREARLFRAGDLNVTLPASTPLYIMNQLTLQLIYENWNKRPIYFALTAGQGNWVGLDRYLTQEGLLFRVNVRVPSDSAVMTPGIFGPPIDVRRTERLVSDIYRYAGLFDVDTLALDPTSRNIAANLSYCFFGLGQAYELLGDRERSLENLKRGYHLNPIEQVRQLLQARADTLAPIVVDSAPAVAPPDRNP
ncbi:MAG: DUF2723 domain-containing protein [Gemmatimonadales bacterium]